jgi:hypothetical protein
MRTNPGPTVDRRQRAAEYNTLGRSRTFMHFRVMKHLPALLALLFACASADAQVLPDRIVVLDPLSDHSLDTAGFTWLNGARLYAEFARYTSGDVDHAWNAKTGGVVEVLRWDSSANVTLVGTMEVVVDPNNDITFNPRAIFWEEGVLAGIGLGHDVALQAGYIHRCKHDIDNLEILEGGGSKQQRTLIYSGVLTRLLVRHLSIGDGAWSVAASGAVRNDLFLHLLDDRLASDARGVGDDIEAMIDAISLTARVDAGPRDARWRVHALASAMATLQGSTPGFSDRFDDMTILGSMPFAEIGIDLFNPTGSAFTLYLRGEWQRDAGVGPTPTSASLMSIGVRVGDARGVW